MSNPTSKTTQCSDTGERYWFQNEPVSSAQAVADIQNIPAHRGPAGDLWRVDVAGCTVLVKGEPSKDFMEHVNRRMARMKMALHKIENHRYGSDSTDAPEDQAEYWAKSVLWCVVGRCRKCPLKTPPVKRPGGRPSVSGTWRQRSGKMALCRRLVSRRPGRST